MAEYAVKYDAYPLLPRCICKLLKVRIRSESLVYMHVVAGVIAVVGSCLKNRVKINACDSK